jgi:DeoR/GlpR family transcriptional regulator of sugar metabolism
VIAPVEAVHKVITDDKVSPEMAGALRARNVEVVVV